MTERDRLYDIIKNMPPEVRTEEEVTDYLLDNGVIVPPCKLGDLIYEITAPFGDPFLIAGTVCAIHVSDHSLNSCLHKREDYIVAKNRNTSYVKRYKMDKFGVSLFTDIEKAKNAIQKAVSE